MLRPQDILYAIPVKEIARICKVDLTTARRWKRGAKCPPPTALMILSGDLGCFDRLWEGWRLMGGEIVSPEGWRASRADVLSIQLTQMQLAAYRHENKHLRQALDEAEVAEFEEQPLPENWSIAIQK